VNEPTTGVIAPLAMIPILPARLGIGGFPDEKDKL